MRIQIAITTLLLTLLLGVPPISAHPGAGVVTATVSHDQIGLPGIDPGGPEANWQFIGTVFGTVSGRVEIHATMVSSLFPPSRSCSRYAVTSGTGEIAGHAVQGVTGEFVHGYLRLEGEYTGHAEGSFEIWAHVAYGLTACANETASDGTAIGTLTMV